MRRMTKWMRWEKVKSGRESVGDSLAACRNDDGFRSNSRKRMAGYLSHSARYKAYMGTKAKEILVLIIEFLANAALETLWPTRCAVCDEPGSFLCADCSRWLPYIEPALACPLCGAPYGRYQCCECNPISLLAANRERLPFDGCMSVVSLTRSTGRVITLYKDRGEQSLGPLIGQAIALSLNPSWITPSTVLTYIPASKEAIERRGFDHSEIIAHAAAEALGVPVKPLLVQRCAKDQRALGRHDRFLNTRSSFAFRPDALEAPEHVLLLDDVYTTGATLFSACDVLAEHGAQRIHAATFARA